MSSESSHAIEWFFNHEEAGIILEDDCLPDGSFFRYCTELLAKYATSPEVSMISGSNCTPFFGRKDPTPGASYLFSNYFDIWGWATWRRAWKSYDWEMENWDQLNAIQAADPIFYKQYIKPRLGGFQHLKAKQYDLWDSRLVFSFMVQQGRSIFPTRSLIRNIGSEGGVTVQAYDPFLNMESFPIDFPLKHPATSAICRDFDLFYGRWISPRTHKKTVVLILKREGLAGISSIFKALLLLIKRSLHRFPDSNT